MPIFNPKKSPKLKLKDNHTTGIYFLFDKRRMVYIGQSLNIYSRIDQHIKESKKDFMRYNFVLCSESELDYLEKYYINLYKPKYNIKLVYENEKQKIKREAKEQGIELAPNKVQPQEGKKRPYKRNRKKIDSAKKLTKAKKERDSKKRIKSINK